MLGHCGGLESLLCVRHSRGQAAEGRGAEFSDKHEGCFAGAGAQP